MKFFNKIFCLIFLLSHFNNNSILADVDDAGVVVASAAAGAAAGFGIYQLFNAFCSSSDSLVDEACKELMKAKQYSKQLEILAKEFKGLESIDKKQEIMSVNEDIADQLSSAAISKKIDDNYVYDLKKNIKNLKYYQTKFPKRVRKLSREKNQNKYAPIIKDMEELIIRINKLLPKLDDLNSYIDNHRKYFDLEIVLNQFTAKYRNEFKLTASKKINISELKRIARSKCIHASSYPLLDYIKIVNNDLAEIDKYTNKAFRYEDIYDDAMNLKKKTYKIKDLVTSDSEYSAEKRAYENEQALSVASGFIGAAAGIAVGAAIASKPKEEVVYVQEEIYEPTEIVEEYIIEE